MANKSLRIIFSVGLMLLVFILVSVSLFHYVIILDESIDTNMINIEIEHTDNNNIILNHNRGADIDSDEFKIMVDDEPIDVNINGTFSQGNSIVFNETPNNEEFRGDEKIDVYVNDEKIESKIINK